MTYSLCNNHHKQPATAILDKQIGDRDLQDSGLSKSAVVSEWSLIRFLRHPRQE